MSLLSFMRKERDTTDPASRSSSASATDRQNEKPSASNSYSRLSNLQSYPQPASKLLSLPLEIQQRIYGYVFARWSMAVLLPDEEDITTQYLDSTFLLKKVGNKRIAGPPGCELLLVCRAIYNAAHKKYGESCTGTLLLGKVKGKMRRGLPAYLEGQVVLRRFYPDIRRLFVYFAVSTGKFGMNVRKMFPNMMYADCVVHEGGYGPMVRLDGTVDSFLYGRQDEELCDWTRHIVNYFLCDESRWISKVHNRQCPWEDPAAAVNIKVLGTINKGPGVALGFNYRWEGADVRMVAHIVRDQHQLRFWEQGMDLGESRAMDIQEGNHVIPRRFRWVQDVKW